MIKRIFPVLILVFILASCGPQKISRQNIARIYELDKLIKRPVYTLYHFSNDSSRLYIRLNSDDFLYVKEDDNSIARAQIRFAIRLFNSYETAHIVDSTNFVVTHDKPAEPVYFYNGLDFKIFPGDYLMELDITDINRKNSTRHYINIENTNFQSRQTFMATLQPDDTPLLEPFLDSSQSVNIIHRNSGTDILSVRHYNRDFPIALPPFSMESPRSFNYVADSVFYYSIKSGSNLNLPGNGFYHFQIDTTQKTGYTLFRFHEDYPQLTEASLLIEPLRYLTTRREYEELRSASDKKKAVDDFWLKLSGNPDRGRQLIRKYYSRVEEANRLFTSYLEGWKSDRGLIYIIFGQPNFVYRTAAGESWVYGEPRNALSVTFNFAKVKNPFSDNDYSLNRSLTYENVWFTAVETWRQGRVFNDN
jgi:GWxTD domain-containing protein